MRSNTLVPILVLLFLVTSFPSYGRVQSSAKRTADASNLRQIGQSTLIYAQGHQDQLPHAVDVWDFARLLAEGGGLESAAMWQSHIDPATPSNFDRRAPVLNPRKKGMPAELSPEFRALKPCWAVALRLNATMPATTPIAWTRGLQLDGTWAKHSPNGNDGGHIVFLGGNVAYFKNLNEDGGQLQRFDGKGMTSNILEALPPGCPISEYVPTPEERAAWSGMTRKFKDAVDGSDGFLLGLMALWLPFLGLSAYRTYNDKPAALTVLIWPLLLTILFAIIVPTC